MEHVQYVAIQILYYIMHNYCVDTRSCSLQHSYLFWLCLIFSDVIRHLHILVIKFAKLFKIILPEQIKYFLTVDDYLYTLNIVFVIVLTINDLY